MYVNFVPLKNCIQLKILNFSEHNSVFVYTHFSFVFVYIKAPEIKKKLLRY